MRPGGQLDDGGLRARVVNGTRNLATRWDVPHQLGGGKTWWAWRAKRMVSILAPQVTRARYLFNTKYTQGVKWSFEPSTDFSMGSLRPSL